VLHKNVLLVIQPDTIAGAETGHFGVEDCTGRGRRQGPAMLEIFPRDEDAFIGKIMLGRPTGNSIVLSALSLTPLDLFIDCTAVPGPGDGRARIALPVMGVSPSQPAEVVLAGLDPDTEYSYQVSYGSPGADDLTAGWTGRFHTQRARKSTFVFTIQADSHMGLAAIGLPDSKAELYNRTLTNIAGDAPDFHIDLGDFSSLELVARRSAASLDEARERYASQRYFLADLCRNVPFYLVLGNHEGEQGWRARLPEDSLCIWGTLARRLIIPNPYPDAFYSGNPDTVAGGPLGDYYAWEWGDALFVVLDPFRYTVKRPHGLGWGEGSLDGWDWTLGKQQYDWLYTTLHGSHARWKFVFAHHMTGGVAGTRRGEGYYGRGGIDAARYAVAKRPTFEWGGEDSTGAYVFDLMRPGWNHGPIHRMMANEGVDIFFRGHDHVFVYETLDGVVYQTCPTPDDTLYATGYLEASLFTTGVQVNNPGHLRVMVSPDSVRVDYVRSVLPQDEPLRENGVEIRNGDVCYTYTLMGPR
jgi:hypothetical protein